MTTRKITPAIALAVSLAEAKTTLRIEQSDTSLDSSITRWLQSITEECEHQIGRSLITQGWRLSLDRVSDAIKLAHPPVSSVESVRYYDANNTLQTLHPADYYVDLVSEPAYIVPAVGKAWPETYDRVHAVMVDYTAGYGPTEASVPAGAQQYILAKLVVQFDTASAAGSFVGKPFNVEYLDRLLDQIRVYG